MQFLVMLLLCDRSLAVHFNPAALSRRAESYQAYQEREMPRRVFMGCYGVELGELLPDKL